MVDYYPLRYANQTPPEPEPHEEQEPQEPVVTIVWNEYRETGNATSFALKISIRLPVQA
jgi:hypothetical protein